MTTSALDTSLAYYNAWTGGDFQAALGYISPGINCSTPAGAVTGITAFEGFMGPFAASLTSSKLLAAFGDEHTALIMYDAGTVLVGDAPGAELHTVADGRITSIKIIFDRQPFVEARSREQG